MTETYARLTKQVVIVSQNDLLANSIKDNWAIGVTNSHTIDPGEYNKQLQNARRILPYSSTGGLLAANTLLIDHISGNKACNTGLYPKIDLLIIDFDCKDIDYYNVKTVVSFLNEKIPSEDLIKLSKPYKLVSLLKIIQNIYDNQDIFCAINGLFIYDQNLHTIRSRESIIRLTEKENQIFKFILLNTGFSAKKSLLFETVWGYNKNTESSTVDTHLYKLRAKLPDGMLKIKNNTYHLDITDIIF